MQNTANTMTNEKPDDQQRAHTARYEALLQQSLGDALSAGEQQEFTALLERYPEFAEEYQALRAIERATRALSRHTPPVRSEEYWQEFTDRATSHAQTVRQVSASRGWNWSWNSATAFKAAALLLCGFALGWTTQYVSLSRQTVQQMAARPFFSPVTNLADARNAEVTDFLQQSHLLLLGMMNLSGECRVVNPESLVIQRQNSLALLFKAQQLKRTLPANQPALTALLTETEHALAVVAALHPSTLDAEQVREVQMYSGSALCEISTELKRDQRLAKLQ
jgi:hypothetical protein